MNVLHFNAKRCLPFSCVVLLQKVAKIVFYALVWVFLVAFLCVCVCVVFGFGCVCVFCF